MALNSMGAGFVLRAYDAATPVVRKIGASFGWLRRQTGRMTGGMNNSLGSLATGFMALQAGLGLFRLVKHASDFAGEFQQTIVAVGKVARATSGELETLRIAAIDAALVTKFSPKEAAEGLQTLAAMGWRASEAVQILVPTLELATGSLGQLGITGAADAVSGSLKAMGWELSEAGRVTDQLLKITQMTNLQARDFEQTLGRSMSAAKLYGQSFEDTLIALGQLRNMNLEASVAATSIREAYRRLASDQGAQEAVEKYVEIFDKQTGKIRPLIDVMTDLGAKTTDLTDRERMRLATLAFGVRGMAAFNAVLNATYTVMKGEEKILLKGQDALNAMRYELSAAGETLTETQKAALAMKLGVNDLNQVLKTSVGVSREFRDALLDTYAGQKQLLTGAWQTLLTVLGEDFAVALKPAVKVLYEITTAVAVFVRSMSPEAKAMLFKFVGALASLVALGGALMIFSGVLSMLGGSIFGFVFSVGKLLLIGVPVLMLLSGLGVGFKALAGAFKIGGKEGISFEKIMNNVRLAMSGMMSILTGEGFSEALTRELDKAENQGVVKFLGKFERWIERIRSFWVGLRAGFEKGVAMLAESSAFKRLQDKIQGIISIFTGPDAENSPELLESWRLKGEEAGVTLTRLGETVANGVSKVMELGAAFATFVAGITADDIAGGIKSFVDVFRTLGDILHGIKTAFGMIYGIIKLIVVTVAELGINIFDLFVPSKDRTSAMPKMFTAKGWEWSQGAGNELMDTATGPMERQQERLRDDLEFGAKNRQRLAIEGLQTQKRNIEKWMGQSTEEFRADKRNAGLKSFEEAPSAIRQEWVAKLDAINKTLDKIGSQPIVVNMDGARVAEIVGRQPASTGEDSLDDAAAAVAF